MYLNLLQRGNKEKRQTYLAVLDHESLRLTQLIEDILDLSRLESGTQITHLEPIDLCETILSVVKASFAHALEKNIELTSSIPPKLSLVLADSNQIEQVLTNLITNALNYTPKGGQVKILAEDYSKADTNWVCITIADSGPGIALEDLPHLFDRFYRGRVSQESRAPGTGLGLSICKEIINRHHGSIEVESQEGVGSSFKVWLLQADSED
jgi:signal transduction histidine kinase